MTKWKSVYTLLLFLVCMIAFLQCTEQPSKPEYDNPLDEMNPGTGGDPFSLTAQIGEGGILLTWTPLVIEEFDLYELYRQVNDSAFQVIFDSDDSADSSFTDTDVRNGNRYTYYIIALDGDSIQINSNFTELLINITPIISIYDDNGYSTSRQVNITLLAYGAASMRIGAPDLTGAPWEDYSTAISFELPAGQDVIVVQAEFAYPDGDTSDVVSDTTRPLPMNPAVSINDDAEYAPSRNVTLSLSAEGALLIKISNDSASGGNQIQNGADEGLALVKGKRTMEACTSGDGEWIPYAENIDWQLSPGAGDKMVFVDFKNDFEIVDTAVDTIIPLPMQASMTINHDSIFTQSREVRLYLGANGDNLECMFSEESDFTGAEWMDYVDSLDFVLSTGEGAKVVYGKFINDFGIIETCQDTILPLPMNPALTINYDDAYTAVRDVWLFPQAQGMEIFCKFSEDAAFTGVDWIPLADSIAFNLSEGGGGKTVYGIFRNVFLIESDIIFDTIEPQTITNTVEIASDSQYVNHPQVEIAFPGDGALEMKLSLDSDSSSVPWQPFQANISDFDLGEGDGIKHAYAWFKNDFFISPASVDSIGLDTFCAIDTFYWTTSGGDTLMAGDLIQFYMTTEDDYFGAENGGMASLTLDGVFENLVLNDNADGSYSLDYIVQSDDYAVEGIITANFTDRAANIAAPFNASEPLTIITYWEATFDNGDDEFGYYVDNTIDGGYIIAGKTGDDPVDGWLIKTNANGIEVWNQTFDIGGDEEINCVQQTSDGGYILAGYYYGAGHSDVWLIKTNSVGIEEWNQNLGGSGNDAGYCVREIVDGYIIVGFTDSYGAGNSDVWLIKTDANGDEIWNQTYGGSNYENGYDIQQTSDGGYVIAGNTSSATFGYVRLIKTDSEGNQQWSKSYLSSPTSCGYSVRQTSDGGYIVAGSKFNLTPTSSLDICLVKTDSEGNELWSETYGGSGEDIGYSVLQTYDGGYIIAGKYNGDACIVKTDAFGSEISTDFYGGPADDEFRCIQYSSDGGYIAAGSSASFGGWGSDFYLIKMSPQQ
ncbi:MAG: hypothetical protein HQ591_05010 [candidate division Zixibacteria bacterium]|nr:hypothetical protein [Candidatus Tariuqbacter arcticus]